MKKLWMIAIVATFFFASCGNKPAEVPATDEQQATQTELTDEQKADFEAWDNWSTLELDVQNDLVARMKEFFDQKMAEKAAKCDGEKEEMCPVKAAKCAEFKERWGKWDTYNLDEKKALIDEKMACCKKKCEAKEGEGHCQKAE